MARLRANVSWSSYTIVLSLATLALLPVWLIRCLVRYADHHRPADEEVWDADWFDVAGGVSIFVLVALVGVIASSSSPPQPVLLVTDSVEVLSSNLPAHVTSVQRWRREQHSPSPSTPSVLAVHARPAPASIPIAIHMPKVSVAMFASPAPPHQTPQRSHFNIHDSDPFAPLNMF
jgi:hypothetical protein